MTYGGGDGREFLVGGGFVAGCLAFAPNIFGEADQIEGCVNICTFVAS